MRATVPSDALAERALKRETPAMARLISRAEAGDPECRGALARIYRNAGKAHIVGITGVPGSGKSTLVTTLALKLRAAGKRIAIVAIDPSSPYSGGSIMGDRIRMTELVSDEDIFIRSMATRGAQGGLARAALEAVDVLDAAGFDYVVIETVGVGQAEVEIARSAHTVVVVSAPGLGDDIQAIKAGILEIADIHVVSKCDRSDASRTISDLKNALVMDMAVAQTRRQWRPPVVPTSAVAGEGFEELVRLIDQHGEHLRTTDAGARRLREIVEFRVLKTAEDLLRERFKAAVNTQMSAVLARVTDRELSPQQAAESLLQSTVIQGRS